MAATIDNESADGAWLREWLAQSHSNADWRRHALEQQSRIKAYLEQIKRLELERDEMLRWQVQSTQVEMELRSEIARLKNAMHAFGIS